jgi:opacity protein-like surface antigen
MRRRGIRTSRSRRAVATLGAVLLAAGPAFAQARPASAKPPGPPRFEVGGGASWSGGYGLGTRDAILTGNADTSGGRLVLFSTESEIGSGPGLEVQIGCWLTRRVVVEGAFAYGQPELRTSISGDAEQASATVASDTLDQYILAGAVRVHVLDGRRAGRTWSPFVSAGLGYVRQLTSDAFTVETGTVIYAGGGVTWTLGSRTRGFGRAWGARADARMNWQTGGIDTEATTRSWPSVSGGLFVRF